MIDFLVSALLLLGGAFMLVAGIGILRMPDCYTRASAVAKAIVLGVGCLVLAAALHFQTATITGRAILVIAFFFLTSPLAAQMIGRAAFLVRVPLWKETMINELEGRYDLKRGTLASGDKSKPQPGRRSPRRRHRHKPAQPAQ